MNPIVRRILERHRNKLLMSAALACGGVAIYAGSQYVNEQVQAERARLKTPAQQTLEVVVASRPLMPGDIISGENMAIRQVPADYVPGSAVTPERFDSLAGQRLMQPMGPGEILSVHALESADRMMFSSRVKPGIRAMTISVDEINSISGMLQPGDRVDLLLTARPPATRGHEAEHDVTVPLLQNLLVMATGRQVRPGHDDDGDNRSFSAVTVEVTPQQAQKLIVAQRAGRLTAVLRNPEDGQPMDTAAVDLRSLFPQAPAVPKAVKRVAARRDSRPQMIVGGMGQAVIGRMPSYSLQGGGMGGVGSAAGATPYAVLPLGAAHPMTGEAQPFPVLPFVPGVSAAAASAAALGGGAPGGSAAGGAVPVMSPAHAAPATAAVVSAPAAASSSPRR